MLRSAIEAEIWLLNVFFKTENDDKISFSKHGSVFKLLQFLHVHQFKVN